MKRSNLYLIIGAVILAVGISLSWYSENAFLDATPTIFDEYDGSMEFYDYVMQNHSFFIYLILVGILIGIIGFAILIAGIVFFFRDRKKNEDQLNEEKLQRREWSKKRGIIWALALGNIIGGVMVMSSALYFGFPTTTVDFFAVSDDYTGILDTAAFLDAGIGFGIGYVFFRPMKGARTIIITLTIISAIFGIIYMIKGHNFGILGISIVILTLYYLRKPKIISYFEAREKLVR